MALTAQIANNSANQPDSARQDNARARAGHAKTLTASARFFGFIRESADGIGNAKFNSKDNPMQKLHRAPVALIHRYDGSTNQFIEFSSSRSVAADTSE